MRGALFADRHTFLTDWMKRTGGIGCSSRMATQRFLPLALLLLFVLEAIPATSQTLDTAWHVRYELRVDSRDGTKYPYDTISIWFNGTNARQSVTEEKALYLKNDTIYIVDDFHKNYAFGPAELTDLSWLSNPQIIWRRRRTANVKTFPTVEGEKIATYLTESITFHYTGDRQPPIPMQMTTFVSDELPMTAEELATFYVIKSLEEVDFAVDHTVINDTLEARGLFPFRSVVDLQQQRPNDTTGLAVTELLSIKRETVPSDFFTPPTTYEGFPMLVPSDEQLWELRAVPMPGGPKR